MDKAIGLMEWVQSLGHDVPELQELQGLKKRCAFQILRHDHMNLVNHPLAGLQIRSRPL